MPAGRGSSGIVVALTPVHIRLSLPCRCLPRLRRQYICAGGRLQSGQAGGAAVLYLLFTASWRILSFSEGMFWVPDRHPVSSRRLFRCPGPSAGETHRPAFLKRGKAPLRFGQDGKAVLFGAFFRGQRVNQVAVSGSVIVGKHHCHFCGRRSTNCG
ncbi:MAG: hypothetical protein QOG55_762 [Acidobacteriaceae bacterium]|nr:hypothetical protein [Acidobacteriaceae bacterium]